MWDDERQPTMVDEAIDRAARELTAGAPGPALRARVLERISLAETRGMRPLPWRLAWAVPIAALLAVLIVARREIVRGPGTSAPSRAAQVARHADAEPPATPHPPLATRPDLVREPDGRARQARVGGPQIVAPPDAAVEALAPERLSVDPLDVEALAPLDPIHLTEMAVPSIDVTPLTIDDRPK